MKKRPLRMPNQNLPDHPHPRPPPVKRLCRNGEDAVFVILNEVKNLMISTESII